MTARHSTIAENVGAGVFNGGSNPVTLDNSIVSGNFDLKNDSSDVPGSFAAIGANIVRVTKGSTQAGGPAPLTSDPKPGNLSSGTMPLLVGSPAIDGGVATANTPSTDQDRSLRPFGPAPDLGAVESRLSADVDLLWLTTSAGPYSPVFERNTTHYTVSVPAATTTAAARAAKSRGGQTLAVRINGGTFATVNDREASPDLPLVPGENQLEVKVTSESGSVIRTYRITIVRGAASDANSGLALQPGLNILETTVTAPDGTSIQTYSVRVTRRNESIAWASSPGNNNSAAPKVSANGRYVAFSSRATDLVSGDSNSQDDRSAGVDIFVHDRTTHTTERVSLTENGGQVNQASRRPSISGDGRYVAFYSGGNNLISGFKSGQVNVYVRDRVANTLVGASVPYSVIPSNRASLNPVIRRTATLSPSNSPRA